MLNTTRTRLLLLLLLAAGMLWLLSTGRTGSPVFDEPAAAAADRSGAAASVGTLVITKAATSCKDWFSPDKVLSPPNRWGSWTQTSAMDYRAKVFASTGPLGRTDDYDHDGWCGYGEYNYAQAEQAQTTAEVVMVVKQPFATETRFKPCALVESAVRMGYNVTILLVPVNSTGPATKGKMGPFLHYGNMRKAELLRSLGFVEQQQQDTPAAQAALSKYVASNQHLYLGVDALHTIVQLSPIELHRRFKGLWPKGTGLVISGEANAWPVNDFSLFPHYHKNLFPFPNMNMFVARLDGMTEFFDFASVTRFSLCDIYGFYDECKVSSAVILSDFTRYPVDVDSRVMQNMFPGAESDNLFDPALFMDFSPEGLMRRRDASITPVVIHWNGRTYDDNGFFGDFAFLPYKRTTYTSQGWLRRPLLDSQLPLSRFHVNQHLLQQHLNVIDLDTMKPWAAADPVLEIFDLCFQQE